MLTLIILKMRNFRMMAGLVLMAAVLFGCIKNEESDGVKALREAQAELIRAKAANETTLAAANAAFINAQAKIEEALALQEVAQAEYQQLKNQLLAAQNEDDIARMTVELELFQIQKRAAIEAANLEAKVLLNSAQIELEQSLRALETEIAVSQVSTPALDEYMAAYKEAIAEVTNLQSEIIAKDAEIATAVYYNSDDELMNLKLVEKSSLEREKDLLEAWQSRYEAIVGNTISRQDAILDGKELVSKLQVEIELLEVAIAEQNLLRGNAQADYQTAFMDYETAQTAINKIEQFTEGIGGHIPMSFLEVLNDKPDYSDAAYFFSSVSDYESSIEGYDEAINGFTAVLRKVEQIESIYARDLDNLEKAVEDAKADIITKEHALNLAEVAYNADDSQANLDAYNAAMDAYNDAKDAYNTAVLNYNNFKTDIDDSDIVGFDEQYTQSYYSWVTGELTSNIDALIEIYEEKIADNEADKADATGELAVVNAYIAHLESIDVSRIPELKEAYFDARASYWSADAEYTANTNERIFLINEKTRTETYVDVLEDQYSDINEQLDGLQNSIYETEAAIAMVDAKFASWESYKEMLQKELKALEDELIIYQTKADKYHALVNAELEDNGNSEEGQEEETAE
jgi:chromosome segregation ATPase